MSRSRNREPDSNSTPNPDRDGEDPSDDRPARPPGRGLLSALSVRRNATIGLAAGVLLAVAVYLVRVFELLGPFTGTREYPVLGAEGYYLLLAFVLATATALLVTTLLTVVSVARLARGTARESGSESDPER